MTTDPQKSTKDVAADQAKDVAAQTKATAADVTGTAKEQGQALLSETTSHARGLLDQARTELTDQAGMQQLRLGEVIRGLANELTEMAGASASQNGVAAGLVGDVAGRAEGAAQWLDARQPAEILTEVRRYARRNPGTFLAGAAVAGFLGGRLTRSLAPHDDDEPRAIAAAPYGRTTTATGYYETAAPVTGYETTTYETGGTYAATSGYDTTTGVQTTATGTPELFDQETSARPVDFVEEPGRTTFRDEPGTGVR